MGASVRGLRLSGSVDAIVDYVGRQTLPDTGINPDGDGIVGYYDAGLSRWEPVGHWGGRQADAEGLDQVRRVELARMVSGLDPNTGVPLGHLPRQGAAVAWDLTFATPKSVSALWALSPTPTRDAIVDAVDVAAAVALELVDRDGAFTRVGPRGAVQVVDAAGLRAAQFRQVTSRAGDPHLHVHTLICSRVQAPDGSWHALDARWLVRYQQAIGRVFDHELGVELQRRLDLRLDWSTGHPEVGGVPESLTRMWSQRHTQIDANLDQAVAGFRQARGREPTGLERAELNQIAWHTTRTAKRSCLRSMCSNGSGAPKPAPSASRSPYPSNWRRCSGSRRCSWVARHSGSWKPNGPRGPAWMRSTPPCAPRPPAGGRSRSRTPTDWWTG